MDSNKLNDFAARYTAAWCSQNAASVASFFGEKGSLKINDGAPAVGRAAITDAAQSFKRSSYRIQRPFRCRGIPASIDRRRQKLLRFTSHGLIHAPHSSIDRRDGGKRPFATVAFGSRFAGQAVRSLN